MDKQQHIFISTGEASGDLLGGNLIKQCLLQNPNIKVSAMGGKVLSEAGAGILIDIKTLSVVGLWEVIKHFKIIRNAIKTIKQHLQSTRPDLVILVDFSGFNLRIAKIAHELGIKVLYYVCPQIWAWRYHRIKKIKRYVDHVAVLFEFEKAIYEKENVPVTFVGHPLRDTAKPTQSIADTQQQYHLNPTDTVIALFPGSRKQEVRTLLPAMADAIPLIKQQIPNAKFVLPRANTIDKDFLRPFLNPSIRVIDHDSYNLMPLTSAAIAASGTATLEIAIQQVPLCIVYKINSFSHLIARRLLRIDNIGLCNIINQKLLAKEFLQDDVNPKTIADETVKLIKDKTYRADILKQLEQLPAKLGQGNASARAADVALELIGQP